MKNDSLRTLELFCANNRSKKHQIFEKWDNFENLPSCKGYSPCKGYSLGEMHSLGKKFKMPKRYEKRFFKNVTVVLCKKNRWKKHQIFEKWEKFENLPSCKRYSPCKGYSLGEMRSLGQRLKMPKRYEKRFFNNVAVVLCKKTARKSTKYSRNEIIFKIGHLAKAIAHAKAIALAKCSVWVKN